MPMMDNNFSLSHTTKYFPTLPYEKIKDELLSKKYSLSLVFVGEDRARNINQSTRNKSYVPNVLSFPLTELSGEIYICPAKASREAKKFSLSPKNYIAYLFIHGLLHLKGHKHGQPMEKLEKKYMKKYGFAK